MKYKIGDRVKAICDIDPFRKTKNKLGNIIGFEKGNCVVKFDDDVNGWSGDTIVKTFTIIETEIKSGCGLFVPEECLELIPSKTGEDMLKELGYVFDDSEINGGKVYYENKKHDTLGFNFIHNIFGKYRPNWESGDITIPELKAIIQIFREKGVEI